MLSKIAFEMKSRLARQEVLWALPKSAVGAEVGVFDGDFSARILFWAKPRRLYLVDPWIVQDEYPSSLYGAVQSSAGDMERRYQKVLKRFDREIGRDTVKVLRDLSVAAATGIGDEELDFLYVDALHTYDGVRADLEAYYPKVKTGGLIVGDDYRLGSWWGNGVVRAFNEFVVKHSLPISFLSGSQIAVRKTPYL